MISRVVYPMVNLGISGEVMFSEYLYGDNRPDKDGDDDDDPDRIDAELIDFTHQLLKEHAPSCRDGEHFIHQQDILAQLLQCFDHALYVLFFVRGAKV